MRIVNLAGGAGLISEAQDPPMPKGGPTLAEMIGEKRGQDVSLEWARDKREKEAADAADAAVQALIDDIQALRATVKAAPSGPLTLTKAQTLTILRAALYLLKGDK